MEPSIEKKDVLADVRERDRMAEMAEMAGKALDAKESVMKTQFRTCLTAFPVVGVIPRYEARKRKERKRNP